jgi:glycosyltransferase involved in cell wall biosynthesis
MTLLERHPAVATAGSAPAPEAPAGPRYRVAMIGSRGFPDQTGGVEKVLESVCPRLATRGGAVRVYSANWRYRRPARYRGVELRPVPSVRTKHADTISRSFVATLRELRSDAQIVHYHGMGSAPLAILPRLFGKRVVVSVHAVDWRRSKWGGVARSALRFGEWASVRFPHLTVAVADEVRRDLAGRRRGRIEVIPNGAEPRDHVDPRGLEQFGLASDRFVLFVGRLVPEKGAHHLIEAFRRLPQDRDVKLALAGPAWYESDYGQRLRELAGDDPRIVFLGEADGDQLATLYSHCRAFVLPSDVEGMSLSLLDSLAYGCATMCSDIPANTDVVDDGALVVPAGDVDAIAEGLGRLVDDDDLVRDLRARAHSRAREEFDWDRIADTWSETYERLLRD